MSRGCVQLSRMSISQRQRGAGSMCPSCPKRGPRSFLSRRAPLRCRQILSSKTVPSHFLPGRRWHTEKWERVGVAVGHITHNLRQPHSPSPSDPAAHAPCACQREKRALRGADSCALLQTPTSEESNHPPLAKTGAFVTPEAPAAG